MELMKVIRDTLFNDLRHFIMRGSGVIVGSPGVGKTYLLKQLRQHLKSINVPHLLLRIEQLGDGNEQTLRQELSIDIDLIDKLKSVPVSDKKAILLFDAFDAARDEQSRKNFLKLIQRAVVELQDSWHIIVTVRTYDAKKSKQLLELFGNTDMDQTQYQTKEILCRHFTIPPFNKDEILQALNQIGCPEYIYNENTKDILANPFNLWLLKKILNNLSDEELNSLSQIRSEVQLFDLFWHWRIVASDNEIDRLSVLEGITREMVRQCSLSVRQSDIRNILIQTAWDDLLSDEILAKVSSSGQQISFSHNILFDYAVSVLLIDDTPQDLKDFLLEDASRSLFLRPSLTYFFTRLWYYDDPAGFWKVFWYFSPRNESVYLHIAGHLIPTNVIANETRELKQLNPIFEKYSDSKDIANDVIPHLLQSLRTLQNERDNLWSKFYDRISRNLNVNFASDLATLTSGILDRALEADESNLINICGRIGRRLLKWVWQEKEIKMHDWYNRLGGFWGVPLVARTYYTDVKASRELLQKVLELTNIERFPINFLTWLTEHVDKIWMHDPEFVIQIYRTIFSHQFTSEGETQRGSPILPITTYRSQDFSMCQYRLVRHFPKFLQETPLHATKAVIQSLNDFIIREHTIRNIKEGVVLNDLIQTFNLSGKKVYYIEDGSYIWDVQTSTDEPIQMADTLYELITELAKSKDPFLDNILDILYSHIRVAFFWKRLLKIASQFPKVFAQHLFDLCIAKPILLHLEVSYELGLFLKNAAYEFTPDQLNQIEERILALPIEAKNQENDDYLILHRDGLLAQIPMDLLCTDKAKEIRQKMENENNITENRPPVSFHFESGTVTEEKWIRDKGVDTTTPENQELQQYSQLLEEFSDEWKKDDPTTEAVESIIPDLRFVYATITSDATESNELIDILWRKLVKCSSIIVGNPENLDVDSFAFCRQVILEGARHELPRPNPELDAQFDSTGYSPFPRHEATKGLSILAYSNPDTEVLDTIEKLANDPVPSVRMLIAMQIRNVFVKNPDRYWKIIDKWSELERNLVVQECLYRTLNYLVAYKKENEDRTTKVMSKLLKHTPNPKMKTGTSDPFISLLMWLVIESENSWAINFVKETYLNDPIQYSNMLNRIVMKTIKTYLDPKQLETDDGTEKVKLTINYLNVVISVSVEKIKELCNALSQNGTEENQKNLQDTYRVVDQVITSLYYKFAHERNKSEKQTEHIPNDMPCNLYREVKPLMDQVIDFADDPETGVMFAPTAHNFMQLLISFLSNYNAKEVIHFAERVTKSSEPYGYNLDSIAVKDIVDFVEIVLADYRHVIRDDEACLESLLKLLDLFAKTGWTDALKLVWRLDEVFR